MRTAGDTATLAVVYVLTHMVVTESKVRDDSYYWEEGGRFPPAGKQWNEGASARHGKPERAARSLVQFHPRSVTTIQVEVTGKLNALLNLVIKV